MGEDAQSRGGGLLAKKRKPKVEFRSLERSFLHKAVILLHTSKAQKVGINSAILYIYHLNLADIAFSSFFARHYYYALLEKIHQICPKIWQKLNKILIQYTII